MMNDMRRDSTLLNCQDYSPFVSSEPTVTYVLYGTSAFDVCGGGAWPIAMTLT